VHPAPGPDRQGISPSTPAPPAPQRTQRTRLELNVPYLAEGALQLLLHAASIQTAALANSTHRHPSLQLQHCQPQPQQQQVLRVGLWVCCWGGCPGLLLSEAVGLYARLQQLPCCTMTGCESINLSNTAELVALTQLQGLVALGFNFTSSTSAQEPLAFDASTVPASGEEADLGTEASTAEGSSSDSTSSGGMGAVWASLTALSSNLRQLSIRGSPAGGWGTPPTASPQGHTVMQQQQLGLQQLPQAPQQHWLSSLTGLTKLSLLKDWSRPALPVSPIAGLTRLQELALERHGLQHAGELSCLSTLTDLRVLSLVLTATADELKNGLNFHRDDECRARGAIVGENPHVMGSRPKSQCAIWRSDHEDQFLVL